jgi:carboxypeptidase Taq
VLLVSAIEDLRTRLADVADLSAVVSLAHWDQHVMMPREGSPARAHQLAVLDRLVHQLASADEVGDWLEELAADGKDLDDVDRDVVRIAKRDWDRRRCVPAELIGAMARAASEGESAWEAARESGRFADYAPALRRNVELAREYAACFTDAKRPYDALLDGYDYGVGTERLEAMFAELSEGLVPLLAELPQRDVTRLDVPVSMQHAAVAGVLRRIGVNEDRWRVDVSTHPFSESLSQSDLRITTRYENDGLESVIAALHEFGHGLYERQIAPELERTNLGGGTSMSAHESQSKLWENHVARNRAFAPVIAQELAAAGYPIEPGPLHAALTVVRPSLIRVSADQVTYPLHIILRFELELALIEGGLDVDELPGAWNDGMRRLLGIEVPDDVRGVMQDTHWAGAAFGYFPSYAVGVLIAAQLWQQLESELGPQDEALGQADVAAIREWLGEHVHRYGRRLDTEPLVRQATGRGVDAKPFLAHARALVTG